MSKELVNEQLGRIATIMGVEPKVINESASILKFMSDKGQNLVSFLKKGGSKEIGERVLNKLKNDVDSLTDDELKLIMKLLDYEKMARALFRGGPSKLRIVDAFDRTYSTAISQFEDKVGEVVRQAKQLNPNLTESEIARITKDTLTEEYQRRIDTWGKGLNVNPDTKSAFFGTVLNVTEDITPLASEFLDLMETDFIRYFKETKPDLYKFLTPSSMKVAEKVLKETISTITPKNVETIRRFFARFVDDNDKLQKEFIEVANEMAKVQSAGDNTDYYVKKLSDILRVASSRWKKDMENLYEEVYSKRIPDKVKRKLSKDEIISDIVKELKNDKNLGILGPFKKMVRGWRELLPGKLGGKNRTAPFWSRWVQFVLKSVPVTFEEIVTTLTQRGVTLTVAQMAAGGFIAKYTIGPFIAGLIRTLGYVGMEINQKLSELTGWEVGWYEGAPWENEQGGFQGWVSSIISEGFKEWSKEDNTWTKYSPWRTYVPELVDILVRLNLTQAEGEGVKQAQKLADSKMTDEVKQIVDDLYNKTRKKISGDEVPEDLKQTLSGDLQFLQDKVYFQESSKLYAIRYQKGREGKNDVVLVKPGEEWGYMAGSLSDPTVKFRSFSDETYREAIIKHFEKGETTQSSTDKTLTESAQVKKLSEQLLVPDKEGETNFQERINQIRERANQVKSSQEVQQIKQKLKDIWGEIEKSTIGAAEKARLWNEKNSLEKQLSTKNATNSPEQIRNDISTDFKPCTGFNPLGCKSESIKKVQKCLSLPESGNFDKTLYNALGQFGWQNGFNDSDVTRVCDLINKKKEEKTKLEMDKKESEEFYKKFPKTTKGSEILDLS